MLANMGLSNYDRTMDKIYDSYEGLAGTVRLCRGSKYKMETYRQLMDRIIHRLEDVEREYLDYYGNKHEHADVQRSKWILELSPNSELVVDSNPITQEAKVNYSDNTSQSVVDLQEPDWEYINFITIPHVFRSVNHFRPIFLHYF